MSLPRHFVALALSLALTPALPTSAAPLSLAELLELGSEGVGEPVLLSIADNQGVAGPLTAEQVLSMKRAGWSDELMAAVVKAAAQPRPNGQDATAVEETVQYRERDGAVVARLRGSPDESGEEASPPGSSSPPPQPAPPQVIVVQAPAAEAGTRPSQAPPRDRAGDFSNGYPVGAVPGYHGSTVFLPARFGGSRPSAFGGTTITTGGTVPTYGPAYPARLPAYGYAGPVLASPQSNQGTLIRTSRGTRRIP